jgi:hypothetical protein
MGGTFPLQRISWHNGGTMETVLFAGCVKAMSGGPASTLVNESLQSAAKQGMRLARDGR